MLQQLITFLYLTGDSVSFSVLKELLHASDAEIEKVVNEAETALHAIGLGLIKNTEGVMITTMPENAGLVASFWKQELQGDLTPATLQVLTLVGYLDGPTREEISYIRGVQSSQSIRTLTVRGLVYRQGEVCTLTTEALKYLGITTVKELPEYENIHAKFVEKLEARTM